MNCTTKYKGKVNEISFDFSLSECESYMYLYYAQRYHRNIYFFPYNDKIN